MKYLTHLLAVLITAGLLLTIIALKLPDVKEKNTNTELHHTALLMKDFTGNEFSRIRKKLHYLGEALSEDVAFTMKLVVEKDISSSEVTDKAQKYMKPMGLSILEITDSDNIILSCGHFPARAGGKTNSAAVMVDSLGMFLFENIKGNDYLTCQLRITTLCAGAMLFLRGGIIVDKDLLPAMPERDSMITFVKAEDHLYGVDTLHNISFNDDGSVIYDSKKIYSVSMPLRTPHASEKIELYLLSPLVDNISLLDLLPL